MKKYEKSTPKQLIMDGIFLAAVGALYCPWATTKSMIVAGSIAMAVVSIKANRLGYI